MNQLLTDKEVDRIRKMCFNNPEKICAIAQEMINTCQIVSVNTFAELKGKHRNTILQQKDKFIGIEIEGRKYVSVSQ
jgi:hypothetical protein